MSIMTAPARARPTPSTDSHVERLGRLYALRQRLELEIRAAEQQAENQESALRRIRAAYAAETAASEAGRRRRRVAVCGTDSGYHKHRRQLKEPACEACLIAHADAERDRTARVKADA